MILLTLALGLIPMLIFSFIIKTFDRFEKEPWWLMVFSFVWGFTIAAFFSYIFNTLFQGFFYLITGNLQVATAGSAVFSAPLVEETMKGLAILLIYFIFRKEFDSILDGIVYGSLVGFGFAALENMLYMSQGYEAAGTGGLLILGISRMLLIPFFHSFCASLTGIGLAVSRLSKGWLRLISPILGYFAAIASHFIHNAIILSGNLVLQILTLFFEWIGVISLVLIIIYLIFNEKAIMKKQLEEEVKRGILNEKQYSAACSIIRFEISRFNSKKSVFFNLCGELAFKKDQTRIDGEKYSEEIKALRKKIFELGKEVNI